jgi:hypothetical protein
MVKIFAGYGIEIFKTDEKYFLKYDSGEIVSKLIEIEISEEDAIRAQLSEIDAYHVILENE